MATASRSRRRTSATSSSPGGASLAAARILLRDAAYEAERIEHVLVAGAFGENLDIENFRALGFLPDFPNARYRFLGNTSLAAAERACVDPGFIGKCPRASRRDSRRRAFNARRFQRRVRRLPQFRINSDPIRVLEIF
ncbi:MAG: ASKHA domain-containing protein [Spirochaetota bacterium]